MYSNVSRLAPHGLNSYLNKVRKRRFTNSGGIPNLQLDLIIPEAFRSVVVHHANRLHERVAYGRTDEPEASSAKLLANSVGLFGARRYLAERAELVSDWSAANKSPYVFVEGAEFVPYCQELSSVRDRRVDFETITYDAGVIEEASDVFVLVTGNLRRIEVMECLPIIFTFVQNCLPRESCLGTLEYEKLEQCSVIVHRDSPFFVVVLSHQLIVAEARPVTSPNQSPLQLAPLLNDTHVGGKVTLINQVGVALDI